MNILLITTTYPTPMRPHQGTFVRAMARGLSAAHQLRVIAPIPWTQLPKRSEAPPPAGHSLHPIYYYPPKMFRSTYGTWYWRSIRGAVKRLLKQFRPDLVLGYWAHPDGDAALRAARLCRVPCVIQVGGSDIRILSKQPRRGRQIRRVLTKADRVIACSQELATQVGQLGVPSERLDVVYRGVDREVFHPGSKRLARQELGLSEHAKLIVWAGRFESVKNPGLFLEVANQLRLSSPDDWRFVMIGQGQLRSSIESLASRLQLGHLIEFTGELPHPQLANWFRAADVTALTSRSEGIPNVLLESIACGTPFVATDVGGVHEIVTRGLDCLVSPDNVETLAQAIRQLLDREGANPRTFVPDDLQQAAQKLSSSLSKLFVTEQRDVQQPRPTPCPSPRLASPLLRHSQSGNFR